MDENTGTSGEQTAGFSAPTPPAVPVAFARPKRTGLHGGIIAAIAVTCVLSIGSLGGGIAATASLVNYLGNARTTTAEQTLPQTTTPDTTTPDTTTPDYGYDGGQQYQAPTDGTGNGTTTEQQAATDEQSAGIVLITTELGYDSGEAAGTGIVLTSSGEILTNNHVVEGSTTITVTIAATGDSYTAEVVGTDSTNDVAVLQLDDASGLTVADLDTTDSVALGDEVTGVGNAGGQGYLTAAEGQVTAVEQEITVSDELTGEGKQLDGLIETDAAIVSGDSGGPLFDADGEVIGIDTAASSNAQDPTGYAIPITDALEIVEQIQSGVETDTVTIGYPAFLGVQLGTSTTSTDGVAIAGAIEGTPAADAGLTAGDTITSVDGVAVATSEALSAAIAAHEPGDSVTITWTDAAGSSQSATVTLIEGPAA
jgi:S1-C subfamily serine protease